MTDALSIASNAILKATEALTRIASHELECARRYQEGAAQNAVRHTENVERIECLDKKVDELLSQNAQTKGRLESSRMFFSGLPNAFWQIVMNLISTGIAVGATALLLKGKL